MGSAYVVPNSGQYTDLLGRKFGPGEGVEAGARVQGPPARLARRPPPHAAHHPGRQRLHILEQVGEHSGHNELLLLGGDHALHQGAPSPAAVPAVPGRARLLMLAPPSASACVWCVPVWCAAAGAQGQGGAGHHPLYSCQRFIFLLSS